MNWLHHLAAKLVFAEIKRFPVESRDLIVLRARNRVFYHSQDLLRMRDVIAEALKRIDGSHIVVVVLLSDEIEIENYSEEALRKLGWKRTDE